MTYLTTYETPLIGTLTLTSDGDALTGCWFEHDRFAQVRHEGEFEHDEGLAVFTAAHAWLDRYFADERPDPMELSLNPQGTAFRQRVWRILLEIPYGQTWTYGDIAKRMEADSGKRMSAQAVGGAVGHNPIGIIIPCHRVTGAKGNLTGFGGGIDAKVKLLEHEGVDMGGFFVPKKGTAL